MELKAYAMSMSVSGTLRPCPCLSPRRDRRVSGLLGEPGFMALFDPTDSNDYDFPALEDNELPATFTSSPGGAIGASAVSHLERSSNSTSTQGPLKVGGEDAL